MAMTKEDARRHLTQFVTEYCDANEELGESFPSTLEALAMDFVDYLEALYGNITK